MFGRSTIGGATRRSRMRLAAFVLGILIVALVLGEVIDQVVDSSGPNARHEAASWSAGLEPLVVQSSSTGAELSRLLSISRSAPLGQVDAMLESLTSTSRAEQQSFAQLAIAPPSAKATSLASSMFRDRTAAMASLASAVDLMTGTTADPVDAGGDCADAASQVTLSDTAAGQLVRVLRLTKSATVPANAKWTSSGPTLAASDCSAFLGSLSSNRGLARVATLRIEAISVEPNPVRIEGVPNPTTTTTTVPAGHGSSGPTGPLGVSGVATASGAGGVIYVAGPSGTLVPIQSTTTTTTTLPVVTTTTLQIPPAGARSYLPPTSSITVDIVVANRGDVAVGPVLVHTQLLAGAGAASPSKDTTIASIPAGGSTYLAVGPLSIKQLGTDFTLYVSAGATGLPTTAARVELAKS